MLSAILSGGDGRGGEEEGGALRPPSPGVAADHRRHQKKPSGGGGLLGMLRSASSSSSSMLDKALANTSKVEGLLNVVVHEATGVSPASPFSPICKLSLGSRQNVRTRAVPRTDQPVWEERLHLFVMATDTEKVLQVQIVEDSRLASTYAQASVTLSDLAIPLEFQPVSMWLDLKRPGKAEQRGRVHLTIKFRSVLSAAYRSRLQEVGSSGDSVERAFGMSLSVEDLTVLGHQFSDCEGVSDGEEVAESAGDWTEGDRGRGRRRANSGGALARGQQLRKRDNYGFPVEAGERAYSSLSTKQFLLQNSKDFTLWGADRETLRASLRKQPIPHAHRAEVWVSCSGIDELRWDMPHRYAELLTDHIGAVSPATEQIEKDLSRTFPGHAIFRHELGIAALKEVLTAFSWSNSFVGYCQSMNFIAGFLLLVMSEEDTFWMMRHLVDAKLPQYFSPNLVGCRADQLALVDMMAVLMPTAHMQLQENLMSIHFITVEWFMRLYIGILPTECTMWVMDCLICDGNEILFGVALALLRTIEDDLCLVTEFDEMFFLLNGVGASFSSPSALIKSAYEELDRLEPGTLSSARQKYHDALELSSTDDDVKRLVQSSNMTEEEIQKLYSQFNIALRNSGDGQRPVLDKATFAALIGELYTNPGVDIVDKLFKIFDRKGTGYVDFHEFLCGICAMSKGTPEEKLLLSFRVFDINDDGFLDATELKLLFGVQQIMYNFDDGTSYTGFELDNASIERLVEKYDTHGNGKLDFGEFCACLSQPPYTLLADRLQLMATARPQEMPMAQALAHLHALSPAVSRAGSPAPGARSGSDTEVLLGFSVEEFKAYDPDEPTPGGP